MKKIRVVIVDDSTVFRLLLKALLEAEPGIEVIGEASNGKEAVVMAQKLKPDLISMDIRMPILNGIEATRLIMSTAPTPIIIITSSAPSVDQSITFRAIEEGALAVMDKPAGYAHPEFEKMHKELIDTVKAMSHIPVKKRLLSKQSKRDHDPQNPDSKPQTNVQNSPFELVAIGSSTGGPQALQQIISALPAGLPVPIVVVQHISPGFIEGFRSWLQAHTLLAVHIAAHNQPLAPGCIYLAPDEQHLLIEKRTSPELKTRRLYFQLNEAPPIHHVRPSVDILFESIAHHQNIKTIAVLLTGMGSDGVKGLMTLHNHPGNLTIVQDELSAVIWGMAGAAVTEGAVDQVIELNKMAKYLIGQLVP